LKNGRPSFSCGVIYAIASFSILNFPFSIAFANVPDLTATVGRVFDGDTFAAKVRLENGVSVFANIRIIDIDAPEINGECESEIRAARAARDRLAELIPPGSVVTLSEIKDDKYLGRIDALVAAGNGGDAGEVMVREGHARKYAGGKRAGWCDKKDAR